MSASPYLIFCFQLPTLLHRNYILKQISQPPEGSGHAFQRDFSVSSSDIGKGFCPDHSRQRLWSRTAVLLARGQSLLTVKLIAPLNQVSRLGTYGTVAAIPRASSSRRP